MGVCTNYLPRRQAQNNPLPTPHSHKEEKGAKKVEKVEKVQKGAKKPMTVTNSGDTIWISQSFLGISFDY